MVMLCKPYNRFRRNVGQDFHDAVDRERHSSDLGGEVISVSPSSPTPKPQALTGTKQARVGVERLRGPRTYCLCNRAFECTLIEPFDTVVGPSSRQDASKS